MNNELFDRMIKENLQEMQVAPSAGLKKVLVWKLFFQNLLVFHKAKLIVGALLISGSTALYFTTNMGSNEALISSLALPVMEENNTLAIINDNQKPAIEDLTSDESFDIAIEKNLNTTENEEINNNVLVNTTKLVESSSQGKTSTDAHNDLSSNFSKPSNNVSSQIETYVENENNPSVKESTENGINDNNHNPILYNSEQEHEEVIEVVATNQLEDISSEEKVDLFHAIPNPINLESAANLTIPLEGEDIELPFAPGVYQEWSFDAYKGLMGQSEITSMVNSAIHREYYWDFHGDNDVLNMNVLGGMNVNYAIGSRIFRVKASTGMSYYTLNDTKAVYEFEEITDPVWLDFFNTDELAWVNTYGEDTCTQCFYAHNTEELQTELKKQYNQYSYVKVPLQLGAQFNFKYVSLDVMGGVDMNFLTKSSGLYVKQGLNPDYERFYYWDNLQLSTLSKGNEMLRKSFMTWSLATNVRVRVTKNFDIMAGYQINKSLGSLTNDEYLVSKTLKSSNATVGVTFYPFRESIKPSFIKE